MKLRLAKKIWHAKGEYNTYKFRKAYSIMIRYFGNYKTPKWVLRKREQSKIKDKILASNTILGKSLSEYINNKKIKR